MRRKLKQIVEDDDTPAGRAFDRLVWVLILLSLATFTIETLPGLSARAQAVLGWVNIITVLVFTLEYLLRIYVADRKLRFVSSFFGLVDLAAIAPFYLALGVDLRSIRVIRLLRVFRVLKLARYGPAIERYGRAFRMVREELILFAAVAAVLLYVSAVGIYYFEKDAHPEALTSIFHALWWAIVTLTTVGYGDVYPLTVGGRIFTAIVLAIGLGIVAVPTGLLASALSKAREADGSKSKADH
jgi:voltage-gated potassium channel